MTKESKAWSVNHLGLHDVGRFSEVTPPGGGWGAGIYENPAPVAETYARRACRDNPDLYPIFEKGASILVRDPFGRHKTVWIGLSWSPHFYELFLPPHLLGGRPDPEAA